MKSKIGLTINEQKIINSLCQNNDCGAKSKDQLKVDNMTWFNESDIQSIGFSKHQAAGYMSSLQNKGLIFDNADGNEWDWYVTEKGIDLSNLL